MGARRVDIVVRGVHYMNDGADIFTSVNIREIQFMTQGGCIAGEDFDNSGTIEDGEFDPLDPCDPNPFAKACDTDTDGDGIPDNVEDADNDGVIDYGETDPNNPDSDNDGLCDRLRRGGGCVYRRRGYQQQRCLRPRREQSARSVRSRR